jgi:hypothetical protein
MSPKLAWPWSVLGLPQKPAELADLRRAYARTLKQIDQSTDIAAFTALRAAYEEAGRRMAAKPARQFVAPAPVPPSRPATETPTTMPPPIIRLEEAAERASVEPQMPDPEQIRAVAIRALLKRLHTASIVEHLDARILRTLADPLSNAPDVLPIVRTEIAILLRGHAQADGQSGLFLSKSLYPVMQELEKRFQWISDYAAFRRDFGENQLMLDAVLTCAGVTVRQSSPATRLGRPQGMLEQKITGWLSSTAFWIGYAALIIMLLGLSSIVDGSRAGTVLRSAATQIVFAPLVAAVAMLGLWARRTLSFSLQQRRERREDRHALRQRGKVIKGNSGWRFSVSQRKYLFLGLFVIWLLSILVRLI